MRSEQAVSAIRMLLPILARFALESTSLRISSRNHISLVAALGEPQIFWGDRGRQQVQRYAFQISAVRDEASAMREERAGCVLEQQLCYFSVDRGSLFAIHHRTSRGLRLEPNAIANRVRVPLHPHNGSRRGFQSQQGRPSSTRLLN